MSTYVEVPADRLLATIEEAGQKIAAKGGRLTKRFQGAEIVFEVCLPPSPKRAEFITIKVFTSIAKGADTARDCGEDAIRIVVGSISTGDFKPVGYNAKVLRTAPREGDRVTLFLERFLESLRDAYKFGLSVPVCEKCGNHLAKRKGPKGDFWGCTGYPDCRGTKNI